MKILYTLLICILSFLNVTGQTYFAFPDSNCVWSVEKEKHLIKGDSIYNSITYKKYYITTDTNLLPSSLQFVGLVRQDIPTKKIFGIASTYTSEALMYNFNLNVNDTVSVRPLISFFSFTPRKVKVTAKDSILINSQYRKRLTIVSQSGPSISETWIEGIGSSFGPLSSGLADPPIICPCFPTLLCQKKNGLTIYVNPVHSSCYKAVCTGTGAKELTNNENYKIYPNPTGNILNIDSKESIQNISVYNSCNQFIDNIEINKTNKTIDFSKVSNGIYFIRISTLNKTEDKKVIISGN